MFSVDLSHSPLPLCISNLLRFLYYFKVVTWLMAGLHNTVQAQRMSRALEHENPIIVAYTKGVPNVLVSQAINPLPSSIYLLSWFVRTGTSASPEYVLRLQNVIEHSADVVVDLAALFPALRLTSWRETTLALDAPAPRRQWGGQVPMVPLVPSGSGDTRIVLSALDMRTFIAKQ